MQQYANCAVRPGFALKASQRLMD